MAHAPPSLRSASCFRESCWAEPPPNCRPARQIPYWQERGWIKQGRIYTGSYQTPYGAFQGWIEEGQAGIHFYLYTLSEQICGHGHWVCFQHRGKDWYLVHMGKEPKDASSGILTIERLIAEA